MSIIGRHILLQLPSNTPVTNALRLFHNYGVDAIQISLGDMTNPKDILKITPEDSSKVLKIRAKHNKYVVVHGKFIYNFCQVNNTFYQKALFEELIEAAKLGADVIIHQGKNVNKLDPIQARQVFVDNVKTVINFMINKGLFNRILLENSSHQGTEIGYSLTELVEIWNLFTKKEHEYLGFCIDTCHIFVAGELDVRQPMYVEAWFAKFDDKIGHEYLKLVHFNDSAPDFNSHNDNHAPLGKGHIGIVGLESVAKICHKWRVPIIAETPSSGMEQEFKLMKSFNF